ncbi:hypothetical protein LINPERHAP1_LOCUS18792 [Linum perenne]
METSNRHPLLLQIHHSTMFDTPVDAIGYDLQNVTNVNHKGIRKDLDWNPFPIFLNLAFAIWVSTFAARFLTSREYISNVSLKGKGRCGSK